MSVLHQWFTAGRMITACVVAAALATAALGFPVEQSSELNVTSSSPRWDWSRCGRVWITVHSPEIRTGVVTRNLVDAIELNWDFTGCHVPRTIGLFDRRPERWNANQLEGHAIRSVTGRIITGRAFGDGTLPAGWQNGAGPRGAHCFWPWVGAGDNTILSFNCLKINPSWMQDLGSSINHLRIADVALAGTHNAGAWRFNVGSNTAARDNFILCQDRSIWAQLVHGIRYLDFRIGFYPNYNPEDNRYWLNHGVARVRPLVPLLREIRRFMDLTREIVILDFHHFPAGFYTNNQPIRNVHNGLLRIVQRELGPHLASARDFFVAGSRGPTLQQLQNANRRLIFCYIDNIIVNENNWLWPRLPHLWANTNNVNTLFAFLDREININPRPRPNERNPLHAAMAQTTPTATDIILGRGSLRTNAEAVNRHVTMRLKTLWRARANIIASDFFLGNNVVEVAIIITQERARRILMSNGTDIYSDDFY